MLGELLKLGGIGAVVGVLFGILLNVWIEPTTKGGSVLLIVICMLVGTILGAAIGYFRRPPSPPASS